MARPFARTSYNDAIFSERFFVIATQWLNWNKINRSTLSIYNFHTIHIYINMRIKTFSLEKIIIWKINDLLNNLASYFQGSIYHQDSSSQMLTEQVIIFPLSGLHIFSFTLWYVHSFARGRTVTIWSDVCICMSLSYRSKSGYCIKTRKNTSIFHIFIS